MRMPIALALIGSLGATSSALPPISRGPLPGLEPLAAYLGTWKAAGTVRETRFSHARPVEGETRCGWSAGGEFLVCDQTNRRPDGIHRSLSIYGADTAAHRFVFYGLDAGGGTPRSTTLTVAGARWTYLSADTMPGDTVVRWRTTNTWVAPDRMAWRSEYSFDGERWVVTAEGQDRRVSAQ